MTLYFEIIVSLKKIKANIVFEQNSAIPFIVISMRISGRCQSAVWLVLHCSKMEGSKKPKKHVVSTKAVDGLGTI